MRLEKFQVCWVLQTSSGSLGGYPTPCTCQMSIFWSMNLQGSAWGRGGFSGSVAWWQSHCYGLGTDRLKQYVGIKLMCTYHTCSHIVAVTVLANTELLPSKLVQLVMQRRSFPFPFPFPHFQFLISHGQFEPAVVEEVHISIGYWTRWQWKVITDKQSRPERS